jgi:2-methylisocitrate lyase-like PEP mutase family enzyme
VSARPCDRRCGGAGIEIEDQLVPKRAHHHKGIEHLIPSEAMVDKVRAAVEAREDPDFLRGESYAAC